ncbi:MAG: murein DD-endopeptidase MepM/ murein hydrolase activator NlpD [Saprospiraceae bacterium]|jgi:murein DD-endopeptidase MepM/ murein hydrolase activator NlpD
MRVIAFLSLLVLLVSCREEVKPLPVVEKPPPIPVETLYGFPVNSYTVVKSKVKKNQFFSDMLFPRHIPYNVIDKLVALAKPTWDIRSMRAGKPYTVFMSKDSVPTAQILVYERNKIDYVVFDMRDSAAVSFRKKPSCIATKSASGIINSSLYLTLTSQGLDPVLANEMAEIYAWTIDFYRIQKGDKFKVIYDELEVEGEAVGIDHIRSAMFEHYGKEHYAIYFEQDGQGDYYDQNTRGLKRAFLKAPVKYSRISSRYTMKRFHPVQKRWKAHLGTDYAAPRGTPIMSTANGTIIDARYSSANGNFVKVKHNGTYTTQYLHMSKIKSGIRRGVNVSQGDVIGYVGSTGLATGPHVCYRFWKNGRQVDALKQKLPQSEPIVKKNREAFNKVKKEVIETMKEVAYE